MESTGARLVVSSAVAEAAPWRVSHRRLGGRTMTVVGSSAPSSAVAVLKSGVDRVGAALALLVLSPVLLALAVAVRLDSDGPALFRQDRVGHRGRLFTMYKFRTMVVDAEAVKVQLASIDEGNGILFKIRRDPRVTRIGRHLRRLSLDELPDSWSTCSAARCPWWARAPRCRWRSPATTTAPSVGSRCDPV